MSRKTLLTYEALGRRAGGPSRPPRGAESHNSPLPRSGCGRKIKGLRRGTLKRAPRKTKVSLRRSTPGRAGPTGPHQPAGETRCPAGETRCPTAAVQMRRGTYLTTSFTKEFVTIPRGTSIGTARQP